MERANLVASIDAQVIRGAGAFEQALLHGVYTVECVRPKPGGERDYAPLFKRKSDLMNKLGRGETLTPREFDEFERVCERMDGMSELVWADTARNTVCTEGKNFALDSFLAGASYTVTGPFLGLISGVGYTATAATDIAAQINGTNGWKEAGAGANTPAWTTPAAGARHTTNAGWTPASAGVKALAAAKSFAISTSGTIKGAFLVYGAGAVATNASTAGLLMSAGVFTGGDKTVANLDTLNANYSLAF